MCNVYGHTFFPLAVDLCCYSIKSTGSVTSNTIVVKENRDISAASSRTARTINTHYIFSKIRTPNTISAQPYLVCVATLVREGAINTIFRYTERCRSEIAAAAACLLMAMIFY